MAPILSSKTLQQRANFKDFETHWYTQWKTQGCFLPSHERLAKAGKSEEATAAEQDMFSIVIPPPNVTGKLHIGHGLNTILQDILVRYHRMCGKNVVWVPGTDHAGIATQNVVEKILATEGSSREHLGRDAFVTRVSEHSEKHKEIIQHQLAKLGASCDWTRENFTFSERLSKVVRDVFVSLWEAELIYKGHYLVNWSTANQTALSDDEVEYKTVKGMLYHINYSLESGKGALCVATTRPETMFGDTAVAVHPDDDRYRDIIGNMVHLPLTDRKIPVIADTHVDKTFGTGVLKITPAHAAHDYAIGERHNLPVVNILHPDGTLNDAVPEAFRGLSVSEARKQVALALEAQHYLEKKEVYTHQVGHCYRTGIPIEPYLSEQWFVKMKPLAEKALQAWESGHLQFYPDRWKNTYLHWMNTIRDWCISRQLWWGHRIPVWYDQKTGEMIVSRTDPSKDPQNKGRILHQDEDVLDTWFSSWLWPFSVLGWPEKTEDFARFYPTTTLVTGYDIIFFWVARMVMAGLNFTDETPFRDVYITPLVRDIKGRKMSKSLGNGVDPLDIITSYGSDGLRFTLAYLCSQGNDIFLSPETFSFGSKFVTKLWNASRFIFAALEGASFLELDEITLTDTDAWMLHRIAQTVATVHQAMNGYQFNAAAHMLYDCVWGDFCDWYVELAKPRIYGDKEDERNAMLSMLLHIHKTLLTMLHPFLPFVSEELHALLPEAVRHDSLLILAPYPEESKTLPYAEQAGRFATMQAVVSAIRSVRSEFTIAPSKEIHAVIEVPVQSKIYTAITAFSEEIAYLCKLSNLVTETTFDKKFSPMTVVVDDARIHLDIRSMIDPEKELQRLEKQKNTLEKHLQQCEKKLQNKAFLEKADAAVVAKQRDLQGSLQTQLQHTQTIISMIKELP